MSPLIRTARHRFLQSGILVVGIAVALSVATRHSSAAGGGQLPSLPLEDSRITPGQQADCLAFGDAQTARHRKTHALRFVGTEHGRAIPNPRPAAARVSPEAAARAYLSVCGSLFGLRDANAELTMTRSVRRSGQSSVVRFQQQHRGVPILGGEMVVHVDDANNIQTIAGRALPNVRVDTTARIGPAAAVEAALVMTAKTYGVDRDRLSASTPEKWVYDPTLLGSESGPTELVWRVEVTPVDILPIRELVLVDAHRGGVLLHFNQVDTALNRQTYTTGHSTALPGTLVCNESNPACAGGDSHAAAAHLYAGDTYNFYFNSFGRNSIDNAGKTIVSTVHYSTNYVNAFWNGTQMVYGDGAGFPLADDVVAHELTHGVTQYTSGLFYWYQSGAINESFSDMFGEFVDQTNGHGSDSPDVKWLMGEDISGLGAIRSMSNPAAFGDPDRMTSPNYYTGTSDNGGVHQNSGINNKAAFLMVDGGVFNGQTIAGLGITKVARIYYEVQTNLLTSGSDYGDLFDALFQGCNNLIGISGITALDCDQVRSATLAVEMNLQPVTGFNVDAAVCGPNQTAVNVFFDNLENGGANWSTGALIGANRWGLTTGFAKSGHTSLYGDDMPAVPSDSSVSLATGVTLPANAFLHFAHAFGFEAPNYDGGVVEYSAAGAAAWNDAGALFEVNGYNGSLASGFGNPLVGRFAFVADSHGYISSRLNLSSLAGQTVRFRWRMGLDNGGSRIGWLVDDVRIYSCANPSIAATPSSTSAGASLAVSVTGGPANKTDWIGLYAAGAPDNGYMAWLYLNGSKTPTSGLTAATVPFTAPVTAGTYEFRLFANDGFTRMAVSNAVTVLPTPTLTINDVTVPEGNSGTAASTFTVALSPVSTSTVTVNYATANGTAASGSDYVAQSGTLTFTPGTATQSIAVAVNGDTSIEPNETFAVVLSGATNAVIGRTQGVGTIVNEDVPPPPTLTPSAATVNPGETVTVTVADGPGNVMDWVGLYPSAGSDSGYLDWRYLSNTRTPGATGVTTATLHLPAPRTPGSYNLRLFANDSMLKLATSSTVTVSAPPPPSVTVDSATVHAAEPLVAAVANGPGNPTDWVGLYPAAAPDNAYVAWMYLNGLRMPSPNGVTGGSVAFTAPVTPGAYNLRFFANDSFTKLATSASVTVLAVPTLTINDVSVTEGDSGTAAATFTVTLAPTSASTVMVNYATGNGSALQGSDYAATTGTLTFPAGTSTQTIAVDVYGDIAMESNETFVVSLGGAVNAVLGKPQGVGTIVNDDVPPAPAVTPSAATFAVGTPITVTITNGPANAADWVGLFPAAADDFHPVDWVYLSDTRTPGATGVATVTLHLTAPLISGQYNVRFFANDSFVRLAISAPITVTPPVAASVSIGVGSVAGGVMFPVSVASGPANRADWMGLYPVDVADNAYVAWRYLSGTHVLPVTGTTAATVSFVAPAISGTYEIRFFANNSFVRLATSDPIIVGP